MRIMKNKQLIKQTPLINIWRYAIKKKDQLELQRHNTRYRKCIEQLKDPEFLENCINNLNTINMRENNVTYYVISLKNPRVGIIGYIVYILPHIAYSVAKGYIPVIDMKNYPSIYQEKDENAWETFFEQPMNKHLEDIKNGRVIYCPNSLWYRWGPSSCPMMKDDELKMWGRLFQQYVRYNEKTEKYLGSERVVVSAPTKTLGALYRGTDYTKGQAFGHPIQPSMKSFADKVEELMLKHGYEFVYLASEEKAIVDYVNQRLPGKVLTNKRVYYDEAKNVDYTNYNVDHIGLSGAVFERDNNKYLIGIEYISSMNLVACCDSFVAGACGGTTGVLVMNNLKFRNKHIFNLGKYGYDPIPKE